MFVEYLSDSAWENRSHRGWTALASFTLQALALSVLLVLPILYSSFVPSLEFIRPLVAPQAQPAPVPESAHAARSTPRTSSLTVEGRPIAPQSIPRTIPRIVDETPPVDLSHIGVPGSTGGPGSNNAV